MDGNNSVEDDVNEDIQELLSASNLSGRQSRSRAPSQAYNYTVGVDRLDQNVGADRIAIRSKKWGWPLFAFLPDAAVNNAWLLYRMSSAHGHLPLDQLGFKRSVTMVYLRLLQAQQSVPKPITPTPTKRQKVAVDVCLSGVGHHLESMPKQRHRSHCGKKSQPYL
ncbi:PiggyBac transposable element-derived protein 3 [Elysia marginata]|uniref:PiggyBac transposable element-derived protein 3 n=1 Tax=Elysia marginata TaxID=1093978 RepID=A0AAV4JS89_9GAST|nr:PiggyBac transposable element-derived protein 3 [Elysia marginata]